MKVKRCRLQHVAEVIDALMRGDGTFTRGAGTVPGEHLRRTPAAERCEVRVLAALQPKRWPKVCRNKCGNARPSMPAATAR